MEGEIGRMLEYLLCMVLFSVGFYAVFVKRNLLKIIIGVAIMGYAVNLFFLLVGFKKGADVPIIEKTGQVFVDPLAQAFILVTVLVGLSLTLLLVALAMRLYEKYKTLDMDEIKTLKG